MDLLTPQEVADQLKVSKLTVLRLISDKKLQAVKFGNKQVRIQRKQLQDFMFDNMNSFYNLRDEFENPEVENISNEKVYGGLLGFATTSAYIPSKNIKITKENVLQMWETLKQRRDLWKMYENHRNDKKEIGYLKKAQLFEKDDWAGIFISSIITTPEAWRSAEEGKLTGYSIGIRLSDEENMPNENFKEAKMVVLEIDAGDYSDEEIEEIKKAFSSEYKVYVNRIYRFSELPPVIINLYINFDLNLYLYPLMQFADQSPVKELIVAGLKKITELMIEDIYKATKNKIFKERKSGDERERILRASTSALGKTIKLRFDGKNGDEINNQLIELKKELPDIFDKNKSYISASEEIYITRNGKKWEIEIEGMI